MKICRMLILGGLLALAVFAASASAQSTAFTNVRIVTASTYHPFDSVATASN